MLIWKSARRTVAVLWAIVLGVSIVPASAQSRPPHSGELVEHCVTVIDKVRPGEHESRVIERHCTTNPDEAKAQAARLPVPWLLVTYWDGEFFDGDSDSIYGYSGPCDVSGYGIPDTGYLRDRISSYRTFGTCNRSRVYKVAHYAGAMTRSFPFAEVDVNDLGKFCGKFENSFDNCVRSMWVWQG